MDVVRKLILEKIAERGLTMKEVSLRIGHSHSYLQQFLKRGIPEELGEHDRAALAALLGVPENELRGKSPALAKKDYIRSGGTVVEAQPDIKLSDTGHKRIDISQEAAALFGGRDLPVFGTAQGGSGALIVTDQAVDYVVRPAPLLRVRDGYGMIVTGESMSPKIESGDTVLVNPHLPPRNGDTCVFRCHQDDGTVLAIVKKLRRFNDDTWFVSQLNPQKDFTLKRSEWQVCHVTVGSYFSR
jgi:phage repressor protein C with HTH and peptisase S24 domain/lambda repressor-like predicted transcriptional regulator